MPGKTAATYVLAFSLMSLAAAIIYFTVQMGLLSKQVPEILTLVDNTAARVEPIVDEIGQVRELISPMLDEVVQTRKQIPAILEEIRLSREQVPLILEEVKNTRQQIPAVLDTVNEASAAVKSAAREVKEIRPLVPLVLTQVEKTRIAIPGMLDKTEQLLGQANKAGKKASQGAVTGVLTGIITAPFVLIGNVGKKFIGLGSGEGKELSEQDVALINTTVLEVLKLGKLKEFKEWKNPNSNHRGKVTLVATNDNPDNEKDSMCKDVLIEVWKNNQGTLNNSVTYCLDKDSGWNPIE